MKLSSCVAFITRRPAACNAVERLWPWDVYKHFAPSENEMQVQAKAIAHLKRTGRITIEDCRRLGTSYGTKIIFRLREKGLLQPVGHAKGERWANNASGKGRHKVYLLKRGAK